MANKYHNRDVVPSKQSGGEGGSNKAMGKSQSLSMPEKVGGFAGVPGKTQSGNRSGGAPIKGPLGPFYVNKEGL